jgi:hypothetical protein
MQKDGIAPGIVHHQGTPKMSHAGVSACSFGLALNVSTPPIDDSQRGDRFLRG